MITSVLLVLIGVVIALMLANPPQYRVTSRDTSDLIRAMSSVPTTDVPGSDPAKRPPGTIRSFYQERGRVTTIMYVSKQALADEKQATLDQLAATGWSSPTSAPPGRVATEQDSYTAVFASKSSLLQLAFTRVKDITAATYIIQSTK